MVGLGGSERVVCDRDACQQALSCGLTMVEQRNPFDGGRGVRRNLLPMVEGGDVQPVEARMVTMAVERRAELFWRLVAGSRRAYDTP